MEFTPLEDISELSENWTGTLETSSGYESHSYTSSSYVETPTTTSSFSRKRRFNHSSISKRKFKTQSDARYTSPLEFESHNNNLYFLSSTLNESLSNQLEKCNINSFTPHFYVERSPSELDSDLHSKRQKLDESEEFHPKTRSAPSTPTKQICESASLPKCKSENLENGCGWSSSKSGPSKPLGSPESSEILYSTIPEKTPQPKPKSPQKFNESIKKLNSPAKKRLFNTSFDTSHRRVFKKVDKDPISVFCIKNNCPKIISIIFSFLSETDLFHVSMVSKAWKSAMFGDREAYSRYIQYVDLHKSNKENYLKKSPEVDVNLSPPCSPERENFRKCTKLASVLKSSQSLRKCPLCMQPAVVEKSVGQCQNICCEYIWCINCPSFSITGPANFHDKCLKSELVLENQQKRQGLIDISNAGNESMPSFLMNSPSNMSISKCDSSGYLSETEFNSPSVRRNLNPLLIGKDKSNILKDYNRNSSSVQKKTRRSSLVSVVDSSTPKIAEIIEPSSPPKVKNVACSRQSKKNLKRLKF